MGEMDVRFNYVSLFSGIGGFEQAFNSRRGVCVMASEVDKTASLAHESIYGKHNVGDITKVRSMDVPHHDLLSAGFPCPTFSVAGGRAGMEYKCINKRCGHEFVIDFERYKMRNVRCTECCDEAKPKDDRGLLFFEVARIAEYAQPKVVLMENVRGLISSANGEAMRMIAATMNKIGYVIDFEIINSKYFDVAHNRDRVFIVCVRKDIAEGEKWSIEGKNIIAKCKRSLQMEGIDSFNFDFPTQKDVNVKLADILEKEVNESWYMSENASTRILRLVDEYGEIIDTPIYIDDRGRIHGVIGNRIAVKEATKKGYAVAGVGDAINVKFPSSKTRRGRLGKGLCHTLEVTNNVVTLTKENRLRKLTAKEMFRLQGFSDIMFHRLETLGLSNAQLYSLAGNAVTVPVIGALTDKLIEGGYI